MTLLLSLLLQVAPADSLDLATLRAAAEAQDPRAVQPELLAEAARLRIEAVRLGTLPQLALSGQATLQNDVPSVPITLPDGTTPAPPHEQARAQVEADWALYDGGRRGRQIAVIEAQRDEQTAGVAVALYGLREATTEAFFGALLLQAQAATLALTAQDLEARLGVLRRQAAEGAALGASADAVEADLIRVQQQAAESEAQRRAALAVLADLTGAPLGPEAALALPRLGADVALRLDQGAVLGAEDLADALGAESRRPEFARLDAQARRAEAEARLAGAAARPMVSVFGQAGVGRPSPFDFLSAETKEFAQVGVRARWAFDWGRSRREASAARLQADLARTEADALARRLRRDVQDDLAEIERLTDALALDDRAVVLREEALRVATRQLDEGVLLPDLYTDRLTDLAEARLARDRHRIERARAQARLLSTLGLYPEADAPADSLLDR